MLLWTPDLTTGSVEIDRQHVELFMRLNALNLSCKAGVGPQEAVRVLSYLEFYTQWHFEAEEKEMLKRNYPEYAEHKKEHEAIIVQLNDLRRELNRVGTSVTMAMTTIRFMYDWLRTHEMVSDAKLGAAIRNARAPAR
jgi:hemerythrin